MIKILMAFILSVTLALVACALLGVNPVLPIFTIIAIGLYLLRRNSPQLHNPADISDAPKAPIGSNYGIYLERADFVPPDRDSHSGGNLRDGVDPNIPASDL
jgi:hypothetical protein